MIETKGKTLKIKNLCCANCARELEEILCAIDGVKATVDFINSQVVLHASTIDGYEKAVYEINHFEDVKIVDDANQDDERGEFAKNLPTILRLCVGALLFALAIVFEHAFSGVAFFVASYICYSLAYLLVGCRVLWQTAKNVAKGRLFDENFLMTVASLGAVALGIWSGEGFLEGVAVMLLYELGELLQSVAVGASKRSIKGLKALKSNVATLCIDGGYVVVDPSDLNVGDVILIKSGDKVAVDGVVIEGQTSLDVKSLTGEPMPRDVFVGDSVLSGSINLSGAIKLRVEKEYKDSTVAKILDLAQSTAEKKAKSEKFISKFARYYTPSVVICAILVATVVPTLICLASAPFRWAVYAEWIYRALSFLVISCPCALVISVPLSYFCGIGCSAKTGVLIKGSITIDALATCDRVLFDKTGTLTKGKFKVIDFSSQRALDLCVAGEKLSSHPIAKAFENLSSPYLAKDVKDVVGKGVECTVDEKTLLLGNALLLEEKGIKFNQETRVQRIIYVAYNGEYVGWVCVDDEIKQGAKELVSTLKKQGVKDCYMLTGDDFNRAEVVAQEVGLDGFHAGLLPDEKVKKAQILKENAKIIYVGDGINDAPVMTLADCAISMGKTASDVAIEVSDVVLVGDGLSQISTARKIAKKTRAIVLENIVASILIKLGVMVLGVALPAFPLLGAVFADVGVMLLAVLNAIRVSFIK